MFNTQHIYFSIYMTLIILNHIGKYKKKTLNVLLGT